MATHCFIKIGWQCKAHLSEEKNDRALLYNQNVFAASSLSRDSKYQDFDKKDKEEMLIDLTSPQEDDDI